MAHSSSSCLISIPRGGSCSLKEKKSTAVNVSQGCQSVNGTVAKTSPFTADNFPLTTWTKLTTMPKMSEVAKVCQLDNLAKFVPCTCTFTSFPALCTGTYTNSRFPGTLGIAIDTILAVNNLISHITVKRAEDPAEGIYRP